MFRLCQVIAPDMELAAPDPVRLDMIRFVAMMEGDGSIDLAHLGLRGKTLPAVLSDMKTIYDLER